MFTESDVKQTEYKGSQMSGFDICIKGWANIFRIRDTLKITENSQTEAAHTPSPQPARSPVRRPPTRTMKIDYKWVTAEIGVARRITRVQCQTPINCPVADQRPTRYFMNATTPNPIHTIYILYVVHFSRLASESIPSCPSGAIPHIGVLRAVAHANILCK